MCDLVLTREPPPRPRSPPLLCKCINPPSVDSNSLGAHEWPKHGTCAAWADATGKIPGLDQAGYYAAMFDLARKEGTPKALLDAAGSSPLPLADLQAIFGGPKRVALGCTPRCELVQVLTCYAVEGTKEGDNKENGGAAGPSARADCPCVGVRDSHYDNSCAEAHACTSVKVLSPEQTGCGGGGPSPVGPSCVGDAKCCPGVKGPACTSDAECESESGCVRCAHSGHCTDVPPSATGA